MAFANPNAIFADYPGLVSGVREYTSKADDFYNCIAFAVGDTERWWDPIGEYLLSGGLPVWPEGCERANTLAAWTQAMGAVQFVRCENADFERGFGKIALIGLSELDMTHIAYQPSDRGGDWYSKIGQDRDIKHTFDGVCGGKAGTVLAIMKRESKYWGDKALLRVAKPKVPRPRRVPAFGGQRDEA